MKARLEIICREKCMVSGLLYLQGFEKGSKGDSDIVATMFKIMKQVSSKEKKNIIQNTGNNLFTKRDIQMLFEVDSHRKYDIEKSSCYIGYKLLWIVKLFLEGR
jgi:hypothetical protein